MTDPATLIDQARTHIEYLAKHHPDCPGLPDYLILSLGSIPRLKVEIPMTATNNRKVTACNDDLFLDSIVVWVMRIGKWFKCDHLPREGKTGWKNVRLPAFEGHVIEAEHWTWAVGRVGGRSFNPFEAHIDFLAAITKSLKEQGNK